MGTLGFSDATNVADANGWHHQVWHDRVAAEVRSVREAAGVIDLCAFAQFEVMGADAAALLDRLSANKIPAKDGRIGLCIC